MQKHPAKYIIVAVLILVVCLWILPAKSLVDADLAPEVERIDILKLNILLTEQERCTLRRGEDGFDEVLALLKENSCHSCIHTLLRRGTLYGSRADYWLQVYLYRGEEEKYSGYIICSGTGEIAKDYRVYHMSARRQLQMMEEIRNLSALS